MLRFKYTVLSSFRRSVRAAFFYCVCICKIVASKTTLGSVGQIKFIHDPPVSGLTNERYASDFRTHVTLLPLPLPHSTARSVDGPGCSYDRSIGERCAGLRRPVSVLPWGSIDVAFGPRGCFCDVWASGNACSITRDVCLKFHPHSCIIWEVGYGPCTRGGFCRERRLIVDAGWSRM